MKFDAERRYVSRADGVGFRQLDPNPGIVNFKSELAFMEKVKEKTQPWESVFKVRLGNPGWHKDYHRECTHCNSPKEVQQLCQNYIEGMVWVLQYYIEGVKDFDWFYQNHYPPSAQDMASCKLDPVEPFKQVKAVDPSIQLLSVLPPIDHYSFLPKCFHDIHLDKRLQESFPKWNEVKYDT